MVFKIDESGKHACGAYSVHATVLGRELQTNMKGHKARRRVYVPVPQLSETRQKVWMLCAGLECQMIELCGLE